MAYNIIPTSIAEFLLTTPGDTWYLNPTGTISVQNGYSIDINGQSDSTLIIAGSVEAGGDAMTDQTASADDVTIIIEAGGSLDGLTDGIQTWAGNDDWFIHNSGSIIGQTGYAVLLAGEDAMFVNDGYLSSEFAAGVYSSGTGNVVNNGGTIEGSTGILSNGRGFEFTNSGAITGAAAVYLVEDATIFNHGTLSGEIWSVYGSERSDFIMNTGVMEGDLLLNGGGDVFISTDGTIDGLIDGGGGDDAIFTGTGEQNITGGSGDDIIETGANNDEVDGGNGEDYIDGGAGADTLKGGTKADIIFGGSGGDTIRGGNGADIINGEKGDDTLFGQGDADVFVFGLEVGDDTIKDWEDGTDQIDLTGYNIVSFAALDTAITNDAGTGDAIIDLSVLGGTGTITIEGGNGLMTVDDFLI